MDGPFFIYLITVVLNLRRGSSRNPTGHSQRKDASKHDQFDRDLHIVVHTLRPETHKILLRPTIGCSKCMTSRSVVARLYTILSPWW